MLKIGLLFAGSLLLFADCCHSADIDITGAEAADSAEVLVRVRDFTVTHEPFPMSRAAEAAEKYQNVGAITLAFYGSDSTLVYSATQAKADDTTYTRFGQFRCKLPVGNYTLVSIGREVKSGDEFVLTSPVRAGYTSARVRETFSVSQLVAIPDTVRKDVEVTLQRIVTMVRVFSTDECPAECTQIRTIYGAASKSFNPCSGLAIDADVFSVTNNIPDNKVGQTVAIGSYAFLPADEQTMDITIQALDADSNVISSRVIPDVTLSRRQITKITGAIFSPSSSGFNILIDTDWLPDQEINF